LKRTWKTKLSDNELIIFDAIFDSSCPIDQLKRKGFDERFNFPYNHSLKDKDLTVCLENLKSQNLIRIKEENSSKKLFVELTAKGGNLWEKEREPIWEKYCEGWTYFPYKAENKLLMEVVSPNLETLQKYLKVSKYLNRNGFNEDSKINIDISERKTIVGLSWKRFQVIHIARIEGKYKESNEENTDWGYFYENLDWWGNVYELNLLKDKML